MVDRAGHLEDDPGVAPLLPLRARLARSPTVALVAAAMLSGAVVWRRFRTSSSPSSRSTRRVYAGSTVWDRNACRGLASTDVALHEQRSCSSHATTSEPARLRSRGEISSRHRPRRTSVAVADGTCTSGGTSWLTSSARRNSSSLCALSRSRVVEPSLDRRRGGDTQAGTRVCCRSRGRKSTNGRAAQPILVTPARASAWALPSRCCGILGEWPIPSP